MNASERGINIQEGPKGARTIKSTVVKTEGQDGFWISTIKAPGSKNRYETLVFPVPSGVDVISSESGEPQFSKGVLLRETQDPSIAAHNRTDLSQGFARTNHERAVRKTRTALTSSHR